MPDAVLYARVSSDRQADEGFSIDAQLRLLRDYARTRELTIVRDFIEAESAKEEHRRPAFEAMLAFLAKSKTCKALLVEKTDRLHRGLKAYVKIDALLATVNVHLVREGKVLGPDSHHDDKFVYGIQALLARRYIDNLSVESKKGMLEKARQGYWPSKAPLGYSNVVEAGRRVIAPDPARARLVRELYEAFARGELTLETATAFCKRLGLCYHSGLALSRSSIHRILTNPVYMGDVAWGGERHLGRHVPIVSATTYDAVQGALQVHRRGGQTRQTHAFAFSGLIRCGHHGTLLVGSRKAGRHGRGDYEYYHCSESRGKCSEPYVRREALSEAFATCLEQLTFPQWVLDKVLDGMKDSHAVERKEVAQQTARLALDVRRCEGRLHVLYEDRLDLRIDGDQYDVLAAETKVKLATAQERLAAYQAADKGYLDDGARLLRFAQTAPTMFRNATPEEQGKLLHWMGWNPAYAHGVLSPEWGEPWNYLVALATAGRAETDISSILATGSLTGSVLEPLLIQFTDALLVPSPALRAFLERAA